MTAGLLRREAARREGWYDLIHSPLLALRAGRLAGQGALGRAARPHHAHDGPGQEPATWPRATGPSPTLRIIGEQQVVDAADRLVANTEAERDDLVSCTTPIPHLVDVVLPGVDLDVFHAAAGLRPASRAGVRPDELVVLFVGRIQPLKAPDLIAARHGPAARSPTPSSPGASGSCSAAGRPVRALEHPTALADLAARAGACTAGFHPADDRAGLRRRYVAADVWSCRRTRSPSDWWRWRRRPAARRFSRRGRRRPARRGRRRGVRRSWSTATSRRCGRRPCAAILADDALAGPAGRRARATRPDAVLGRHRRGPAAPATVAALAAPRDALGRAG